MNTPSNVMPESSPDPRAVAAAVTAAPQPMFWSIRRELWESRSLYIAPLAVAAVILIGFIVSMIGLPERRRAVLLLDLVHQRAAIEKPYDIAAVLIMATAFIVAVFYCLDALHGERRDRSILFWKSLPVSDLTTVLSKASIPLVVLPLVAFATTIVMQLIMLLMMNAVLLMSGVSATTFTQLPLAQHSLILLYGLIVFALWHAPVYGWLLLVSGWARRSAFLWAVLPPIAIAMAEKIAFNTWYFGSMLKYRLGGGFEEAFSGSPHPGVPPTVALEQLEPLRFLTSSGLWIGLAFAAVFLAAAVRQRRSREPI